MSKWTEDEIEELLLEVLQCDTEPAMISCFDRIAEKFGKGSRKKGRIKVNGDLCRRLLWGISVRVTEYALPVTTAIKRPRRDNLPWSWAELQVMKHAIFSRSEFAAKKQLGPPTPHYIACVLQRSAEEVLRKWNEIGPSQGRTGFGITSSKS